MTPASQCDGLRGSGPSGSRAAADIDFIDPMKVDPPSAIWFINLLSKPHGCPYWCYTRFSEYSLTSQDEATLTLWGETQSQQMSQIGVETR